MKPRRRNPLTWWAMTVIGAFAMVAAAASLAASVSAPAPNADDSLGPGDMRRYLGGQFLVATHNMADPRFAETVIYMVQHDAGGAMGLIVNRTIGSGPFAKFLQNLGIEAAGTEGDIRLHYGGPVETGRGFVLHSGDFGGDGAVRLPGAFSCRGCWRSSRRWRWARDRSAPSSCSATPGGRPANWKTSLKRHDWVTSPADIELMFDGDEETKWDRALSRAGLKM